MSIFLKLRKNLSRNLFTWFSTWAQIHQPPLNRTVFSVIVLFGLSSINCWSPVDLKLKQNDKARADLEYFMNSRDRNFFSNYHLWSDLPWIHQYFGYNVTWGNFQFLMYFHIIYSTMQSHIFYILHCVTFPCYSYHRTSAGYTWAIKHFY